MKTETSLLTRHQGRSKVIAVYGTTWGGTVMGSPGKAGCISDFVPIIFCMESLNIGAHISRLRLGMAPKLILAQVSYVYQTGPAGC
jgi:hypothetical protein